MKILLTNDDGIDADGLQCLKEAVNGDLFVVAPGEPVSECSHRITTRQPIKIESRGNQTWAVYGSPADCVRIAIKHLYPDTDFDWVLSGVNQGGNLGVDIFYSGTVAAVREATLFGYRGAAFSHFFKRGLPVNWNEAAERVQAVWTRLLREDLGEREFWNVNLPHLESHEPKPELQFCEPCIHPLPVDYMVGQDTVTYAGHYPSRPRREGSDTDLCFGGSITASRISI